MNPSTIGVDVSKDFLDVHRLADGASRRFANDKTGRKALLKWLTTAPVKSVVFEPTGPYHRALERALDTAGVPIAKVNPRQARRFAEAAGKLVKTDRVDAAMLARMGEVLGLEPRPCVTQTIAELKELHLARAALIKDRTAAKNRAKGSRLPCSKSRTKSASWKLTSNARRSTLRSKSSSSMTRNSLAGSRFSSPSRASPRSPLSLC
jgi:transposase